MTPSDLRSWRLARGLSQKAAAELLGMGLRGYCYLEAGRRIPKTIEILVRILAKNPEIAKR